MIAAIDLQLICITFRVEAIPIPTEENGYAITATQCISA